MPNTMTIFPGGPVTGASNAKEYEKIAMFDKYLGYLGNNTTKK